MTNNYLKGTDINKFEHYRTVMMQMKNRQLDPFEQKDLQSKLRSTPYSFVMSPQSEEQS